MTTRRKPAKHPKLPATGKPASWLVSCSVDRPLPEAADAIRETCHRANAALDQATAMLTKINTVLDFVVRLIPK